MTITNETPNTWENLQKLTCKYLKQAGYNAESPRKIDLIRGKVEVDVYATDDTELLNTIICECKFWEKPIPQEKIHAFRTVVSDSGATLGIIISKNGFQKGAKEAAFCSNVILKDWNGFIKLIARKWLTYRLTHLEELASPLSVYTDPWDILPSIFKDSSGKQKYEQLQRMYLEPYYTTRQLVLGVLETKGSIIVNNNEFTDFNSLFDYLEIQFRKGIDEYQELLSTYGGIDKWKIVFSSNSLHNQNTAKYIIINQIINTL